MHVQRNLLVDRTGQTIVLRGAVIPGLQSNPPDPVAVQTLSATTFSTMRQRFNMNALRLPISSSAVTSDVAEIVRKANVAGLVVILAESEDAGLPTPPDVDFWKIWAAYFKDNPMVIFDVYNEPDSSSIPGHQAGVHSPADWQFWLKGGIASNGLQTVGMQALVDAIRSTGATQAIAVEGLNDSPEMQGFDSRAYVHDANILYEVHPYYTKDLTNTDRDSHFGFLAGQFPLLAGEWGLNPNEGSANCRAAPNDPALAEQLIGDTLAYFEGHNISWTLATFLPGNLYIDFSDYYRTDLYQSWTCGAPTPPALGIGETLSYYLNDLKEGDLVPVSSGGGNITAVARGGIVSMYGYEMTATTETASSYPAPITLGGIAVEITDAAGAVHLTSLLYVSPFLVNLIVPEETAVGMSRFTIWGGIGAGLTGHVLIQDVVPSLYTAAGNGRGAVVGSAGGMALLYQCADSGCTTVPVTLPDDGAVSVSVLATGIRNAASSGRVTAFIGGFQVPVLYAGVHNPASGVDEVDFQLVPELRGIGETDLIVMVDGQASNAVRINIQ